MKNTHERFGKLVYVRRTEKTMTNIRVHLDVFIGEKRGKAHFVSVMGGDVEIVTVGAAFGNGDLLTVVDPMLGESIVSLGDKPLRIRGSTAMERKRPLRQGREDQDVNPAWNVAHDHLESPDSLIVPAVGYRIKERGHEVEAEDSLRVVIDISASRNLLPRRKTLYFLCHQRSRKGAFCSSISSGTANTRGQSSDSNHTTGNQQPSSRPEASEHHYETGIAVVHGSWRRELWRWSFKFDRHHS